MKVIFSNPNDIYSLIFAVDVPFREWLKYAKDCNGGRKQHAEKKQSEAFLANRR